jgi:hypothetical protein
MWLIFFSTVWLSVPPPKLPISEAFMGRKNCEAVAAYIVHHYRREMARSMEICSATPFYERRY